MSYERLYCPDMFFMRLAMYYKLGKGMIYLALSNSTALFFFHFYATRMHQLALLFELQGLSLISFSSYLAKSSVISFFKYIILSYVFL